MYYFLFFVFLLVGLLVGYFFLFRDVDPQKYGWDLDPDNNSDCKKYKKDDDWSLYKTKNYWVLLGNKSSELYKVRVLTETEMLVINEIISI